ncbi:MAG: hypothetical protein QE267_03315 [Akkermansiaceae bacterium]|nr:hypothetical protein [Akkermansiaceae bacterium]
MKPTSETGWWIVTYTIVLIRPSEDPPRSIPNQVLRKQVMVRCEHWREAFMKARRIGIDDELADVDKGRWQYMGINDLIPLPEKNEDGLFLGEIDLTEREKPLEDVFRDCTEDYYFEPNFDEERGGQHYRAILDPDKAGF